MVNKDTLKFFSISSCPGNFGATVYNTIFQRYGINAVYLPLKLDPADKHMFSRVAMALHAVGTAGISVSMPYKKDAAQISSSQNHILNVNTLIRHGAGWKGVNTDTAGFARAAKPLIDAGASRAHIAGYGCVAHSIARSLAHQHIRCTAFDVRQGLDTDLKADWLINATPIGMPHIKDKIFKEAAIDRYDFIFDVVVTPPGEETQLIRTAKKLNKPCVPGYKMAAEQLVAQFWSYANEHKFDFGSDTPDAVTNNIFGVIRDMGYEL